MERFYKLTDMVKKLFNSDDQKLVKVGFLTIGNGTVEYTERAKEALIEILIEENKEKLVALADAIIAETLEARSKESK